MVKYLIIAENGLGYLWLEQYKHESLKKTL
jgi:hypothetical protein